MSKIINTLKRRLFGMIDRGVLTLVNDSLDRQQLQIQTLNGEVSSDVERWQNYGHTSVPPASSEVLALALNGNRSNLAVICAEDKKLRPKGLIEGDSALYHMEGHFFKLTKKGVITGVGDDFEIEVKRVKIVATESVEFETPTAKFTGDVEIAGNSLTKGLVTGEGGGMFAGISSKNHQHKENGEGNMTDDAQ